MLEIVFLKLINSLRFSPDIYVLHNLLVFSHLFLKFALLGLKNFN